MKLRNHLLFLFVVAIMSSESAFAQEDAPLSVSFGIGYSKYFGDLVTKTNFLALEQSHPVFSIGAKYDISTKFRARFDFSYMAVSGDDKFATRADLRARNLNFKSNIWEIGPKIEYDFLNRDIYSLVPYVFTGFNVYHFNPTTIDSSGNKIYLHDVGTEGQYLPDSVKSAIGDVPSPYKLTQLNIPIGVGIRYEPNDNLAIGLEMCTRLLFTDYLDDVSSAHYIDPAIFKKYGQNEAAQLGYRANLAEDAGYNILRSRGNPKYKDVYYSLQLTVSFRINNSGANTPYGGYRKVYRY